MSILKDASSDSLHPFIIENIESGSVLLTDGWSGYNGIEEKGYKREIQIKSGESDEENLLPHIHTIVSLLKRWLLGTHQGAVEEKHLQAYLERVCVPVQPQKISAERASLLQAFGVGNADKDRHL